MNIIVEVNESVNKTNSDENKTESQEQECNEKNDKVGDTQSEKVSSESKCQRRTVEKVLRLDTSQIVRTVWDKVTKSYKETAQNLNDFVQNKLEYVASIRLWCPCD